MSGQFFPLPHSGENRFLRPRDKLALNLLAGFIPRRVGLAPSGAAVRSRLLQPRLNIKLSQRQVLTPGLVQMVSVLALNKLELKSMIDGELVDAEGGNAFAARGGEDAATGLSREGRLFLAGLLNHAAPAAAFLKNPRRPTAVFLVLSVIVLDMIYRPFCVDWEQFRQS